MQEPPHKFLPTKLKELTTLLELWREDVDRCFDSNFVEQIQKKTEAVNGTIQSSIAGKFTDRLLSYSPEVLSEMLDEVADKEKIKDGQGNTPLHYLCKLDSLPEQSFKKYLEILLQFWAIDVANGSGRTPLHTAIESRKPLKIILCLLDKRADVIKKDNNGKNSLHILCQVYNADSNIAAVLQQSTQQNLVNDFSDTTQPPLHLALHHKNLELAKWLLERSTQDSIKYKDWQQQSLLHVVANSTNQQTLDLVLSQIQLQQLKEFANTPDKQSNLPINLAARLLNNWDICAKLVPVTDKLSLESSDTQSFLIYVIEKNDSNLLKQMFEKGACFHPYYAQYILGKALWSTPDILEIIQNQGKVKIQTLDENVQTQLMEKAINKDNQLAQHIIQSIVAKLSSHLQATILKYLIHSRELNLLQIALDTIDKDYQTAGRASPLFYAIQLENLEAVRLLLNAGARIGAEEELVAKSRGNFGVVDHSLELLIISNSPVNGITPLTKAIQDNDLPRLGTLLCSGALPNYANDDGSYPIHWLAKSKIFSDALSILVENKVDIDRQNNSGDTALHIIASDSTKLLALLHCKPKCIENNNHQTPCDIPNADNMLHAYFGQGLWQWIKDNNINKIEEFLKHFPGRINEENEENGQNLLHYACSIDCPGIVQLLLDVGVDSNKIDKGNKLPVHYCNNEKLKQLMDMHTRNDEGLTPVHRLWKDHDCTAFQQNKIPRSAYNIQDNEGRTLLHYICLYERSCKCFESIMTANPNLVIQDSAGNTVLHLAVSKIPILEKLVSKATETEINIQNNEGQIPLHLAANTTLNAVELLKKKSLPRARDKNGKLPLAYAIENDKIEDIITLLSPVEETNMKFDDLVGLKYAKEKLTAIIHIYQYPKKCRLYGVTIPKAILFEGPPGVGKTVLARAFSNEMSSNKKFSFKSVCLSQFNHSRPGEGEKRLDEEFEEAYNTAPTILFLDEVDSIAALDRENIKGEAGNESRKVLNLLLKKIEGFEKRKEIVIVIAATNLASTLDKAFIDRFQETIHFALPNEEERESILNHYFNRVPILHISTNLSQKLASESENFSIRKLRAIVENGCRMAYSKDSPPTDEVFFAAFDQVSETLTITDEYYDSDLVCD